MINFIQINDCKFNSFLKIVLSIQFAILINLGLDNIGLHIPILRQLIGFIYLAFIPGIIILRILRLHNLGNIVTIFYGLGLSLGALMFLGLFMNLIYPLFGFSKPISSIPLIFTLVIFIILLCTISYIRDRDFNNPSKIDIESILSPLTLFLCLIPFLAIFGDYLVNFHQNNFLLMVLILIIALVVLLIAADKLIPSNIYPLAVFVIAISLLYSNSLISPYIWGWDINYEYNMANHVKLTGFWDSTISDNIEGMLSIVMIAPIFSNVLNLDLTWIFKIVYPFFFSLLPLGLYHIFEKQTNEKIAFLSVFYLMSINTFFTEMLTLARQQIGEIFLILIILTIIAKIDVINKRILTIFFGACLIVSHYGISYIFLFFSPIGYILMYYLLKYKSDTYRVGYLILYSTTALLWYIYITSGSIFLTILTLFDHIYNSLLLDFFDTTATTIATSISSSIYNQILKEFYLISQFLIIIGFLEVLTKFKKYKFKNEYFVFSALFILIMIISVITSSTGMKVQRLFHIASLLLSPFFLIGIASITSSNLKWRRITMNLLSAFIVLFFLLNTGFLQELAKDSPRSISLNQELYKNGEPENINAFYGIYNTEYDVLGVTWIAKNRNSMLKVHADKARQQLIFSSYGNMPSEILLTNYTKINDEYVYLAYPNIRYGLMYGPELGEYWHVKDILPSFHNKFLIYTNGGSKIYI